MSYEFRKVHIDLVTDRGEVCVLTMSWRHLFGRWRAHALFEIFEPNGTRTTIRAKDAPQMVDPSRGLDQLPVALTIPGGKLEIEVRPIHDAWVPPAACPVQELRWSIGALRAATRFVVETKDGTKSYAGEGFVDFLVLNKTSRRAGLRCLRWGRAHMFERSLAFYALELTNDRKWFVGVTRLHGRDARGYGNLALEFDDGAGVVRFGRGGQVLRLKKPRLLHAGSAIDPVLVPSPTLRWGLQTVVGFQDQKRWLCEARVDASHGVGKAFHGVLWFGRSAHPAASGKQKG